MTDRTPIIEATNMDKFYGDFHALKDVNITVHKGEKMVVCGPSGSGKSTLIRCFNGLEFHNSGTLVVDGIEVYEGAKQIRALRQEVGMVFQQFNLFPHLTVLENLMIGPMKVRGLGRTKAEETARKYLDRVHIPEQADKYPSALSGGQQQRVAIARSLCMETRIMLFDVTHEMGFARKVADTMVFMEAGRIVESSPPEQFFTNPSSERCRLFLDQILEH